MSEPLKLICKKGKIRKDGTGSIKLQYCHSSEKRTELDTEIGIPPRFWNRKSNEISKELPKEYGDVETLNNELIRMYRVAEDLIKLGKQRQLDIISFLKSTFKPDFSLNQLETTALLKTSDKDSQDFFFQYDEHVKKAARRIELKSLQPYYNVKRCFREYEIFSKTKITFADFTPDFLEDFIDFLTYDTPQGSVHKKKHGLAPNTINLYLNLTREFIQKCSTKGLLPSIDSECFKIKGEQADAIYLTYDEISIIFHLKIKNHKIRRSRDLFVLGCLTGMRFGDFTKIELDDIKNGFIRKKTDKTDVWVYIPIRPECAVVLGRLENNLPQIDNSTFNRHIAIIGNMAGFTQIIKFTQKRKNKTIEIVRPKYQWMKSHTARRSFCTNEFLAGTPVELIMKISGHKTVESFYRYIRITNEEAGLKVMEIWKKRGLTLKNQNRGLIGSPGSANY